MNLTAWDRVRIWIRCLVAGVLASVSFGLGLYAVAPGGVYADFEMEKPSFDPHHYLWSFQVPGLWDGLILHALLASAAIALFAIMDAVVAGVILTMVEPHAGGKLLRATPLLMWPAVAVIGFGCGLLLTIATGMNPGFGL